MRVFDTFTCDSGNIYQWRDEMGVFILVGKVESDGTTSVYRGLGCFLKYVEIDDLVFISDSHERNYYVSKENLLFIWDEGLGNYMYACEVSEGLTYAQVIEKYEREFVDGEEPIVYDYD